MSTFEGGCEADFEPWRRWEVPGVAGDPGGDPGGVRPPTAQELEVLRQAAHQEGFEAGRGEGLRQGAHEVRAQLDGLRALIDSLARPLARLDERVEEELVALAITLVRQLVRREIRTDPGVIVAAVREAVSVLPLSAREIAVKVHPEDAVLLRELYPEHALEGGPGWRLIEGPAITRGGCVVVTDSSEVDATLERRLAAAIRHVFGGERTGDLEAELEADPPSPAAGAQSSQGSASDPREGAPAPSP